MGVQHCTLVYRQQERATTMTMQEPATEDAPPASARPPGRLVLGRVIGAPVYGTIVITHGGEEIGISVWPSEVGGEVKLLCQGPLSFRVMRYELVLAPAQQAAPEAVAPAAAGGR